MFEISSCLFYFAFVSRHCARVKRGKRKCKCTGQRVNVVLSCGGTVTEHCAAHNLHWTDPIFGCYISHEQELLSLEMSHYIIPRFGLSHIIVGNSAIRDIKKRKASQADAYLKPDIPEATNFEEIHNSRTSKCTRFKIVVLFPITSVESL